MACRSLARIPRSMLTASRGCGKKHSQGTLQLVPAGKDQTGSALSSRWDAESFWTELSASRLFLLFPCASDASLPQTRRQLIEQFATQACHAISVSSQA